MDEAKYTPRKVRDLIKAKDFLRDKPHAREVRRNTFIVYLAGTKAAGKTTASDEIFEQLQSQDLRVCSTRASADAYPAFRVVRKALVEQQEKGNLEIEWHEVVDALKSEGRSAIKRIVIPFLYPGEGDTQNKKNVLLLNRYPLPDTLARQSIYAKKQIETPQGRILVKVPLEDVVSRLAGTDKEPASYLRPDLTILLTCRAPEAIKRIRYRNRPGEVELGVNLGADFNGKIEEQIKAYQRLAGYDESKDIYDPAKKAFPGEVLFIDTTENLDYSSPKIADILQGKVKVTTRRILEDTLFPAMKRKFGPR